MPLMSFVSVAGVGCHSRVVCLLQVLDPLTSCVSVAGVGCHS